MWKNNNFEEIDAGPTSYQDIRREDKGNCDSLNH